MRSLFLASPSYAHRKHCQVNKTSKPSTTLKSLFAGIFLSSIPPRPRLVKSNVGNLLAAAVTVAIVVVLVYVVVLLTRNRNRRCAAPTWQNLRQLFGRLENVHRAYKLAKLEARERQAAAAASPTPQYYSVLSISVSCSGKCQSFGIKKCFQIKLIYII